LLGVDQSMEEFSMEIPNKGKRESMCSLDGTIWLALIDGKGQL